MRGRNDHNVARAITAVAPAPPRESHLPRLLVATSPYRREQKEETAHGDVEGTTGRSYLPLLRWCLPSPIIPDRGRSDTNTRLGGRSDRKVAPSSARSGQARQERSRMMWKERSDGRSFHNCDRAFLAILPAAGGRNDSVSRKVRRQSGSFCGSGQACGERSNTILRGKDERGSCLPSVISFPK